MFEFLSGAEPLELAFWVYCTLGIAGLCKLAYDTVRQRLGDAE